MPCPLRMAERLTLEGRHVRLEPLSEAHIPALVDAAGHTFHGRVGGEQCRLDLPHRALKARESGQRRAEIGGSALVQPLEQPRPGGVGDAEIDADHEQRHPAGVHRIDRRRHAVGAA